MSDNIKKIVFQGDSITDACRAETKDDLGYGYVRIVCEHIAKSRPDIKVINTGISGDRVCQLQERWQKDTLDHKPDLLTIMIGINEVWGKMDHNDPTSDEDFLKGYEDILKQSLAQNSKIILLEPFVLWCGCYTKAWDNEVDNKIKVVRTLAKKYNLPVVPLKKIFDDLQAVNGSEMYAPDGVHPADPGKEVIAKALIEEIDKLI